MKLLVFSDRKKTADSFASLANGRSHEVEFLPRSECRSRLKKEREGCIVYFDIQDLSEAESRKELRYLLKLPGVLTAVIDGKGAMDDPAAFFHDGGVDYLGKKQLQEGVSLSRLKNMFAFIGDSHPILCALPEQESAEETGAGRLVPGGEWKRVKQGEEYLFYFLFAELDLTSDWKVKSGRDHLKQVQDHFQEYIRKAAEPINGRVWMWNEFGGLVLIPRGETPSPVVLTACKLMINRSIASCEEFPFKTPISYRLGLHLGETVYRERGSTGTIVSDTINFTFHLGMKYARPGCFYITRTVFEETPESLKDLFIKESEFEGREIYRMRSVL